jgi:hypothetical protein
MRTSRSVLLKLVFSFAFLIPTIALAQDAEPDTIVIHRLLDQWHLDAAQAKSTPFFAAMDEHAIYIGTADFERWTKSEFMKFAMPYFARGKAWDFEPYDRRVSVTLDGRYAWFSELLTTWMGVCRGSGILVKTSNGWRIQQYHLSVTVPNEIIGDFIKLVDGYNTQRKK